MRALTLIIAMAWACFSSQLMRGADSRYFWLDGEGAGVDSSAPFALGTLGRGPGEITSRPVLLGYIGTEAATTTLADSVAIGDTRVRVTDTTGMAIGQILFLIDTVAFTIEQFEILSIDAPDTVNVDMPSGNGFSAGTFTGAGPIDMNVNGSVTPVKFNVKFTGSLDFPGTLRFTRLIFTVVTASTGSIGDFGDIVGGLTNGVYLRLVNSTSRTIFNLKKNVDFAQIAYDLEEFPAAGPFGADGFRCRLTFTKMGGVIDVGPGEDLELWVQDDLSSLVRFRVMLEGTIVAP